MTCTLNNRTCVKFDDLISSGAVVVFVVCSLAKEDPEILAN